MTPRSHPRLQAASARACLLHVRPGTRVLDVAAGSGWSTLLLAAQVGCGGHVWALEDDPRQRGALVDAAARAGLADRITLAPRGAQPAAVPPVDLVHLGVDCDAAVWLRDQRTWVSIHRPAVATTVCPAAAASVLRALHGAELLAAAVDGTPVQHASQLTGAGAPGATVVAHSATARAGFPVRVMVDERALLRHFGLHEPGRLLEPDLDVAHNECERFSRKRRDAEVLCGLAASFPGPCLDLGTSHGRSAFKLATNIGPDHRVLTVNVLPEDAALAGRQITHLLTRDEIGAYYRSAGLTNVDQVFANTMSWEWPARQGGFHLAFVDACHDTDAVLHDSLRAWERLAPGGFLVWHDFAPGLRGLYPWIDSVVRGIARFREKAAISEPVAWLAGSWCGVLRKESP